MQMSMLNGKQGVAESKGSVSFGASTIGTIQQNRHWKCKLNSKSDLLSSNMKS